MNDEEGIFDEGVQERLLAAARLIIVDVEGEWETLVERLALTLPVDSFPGDANVDADGEDEGEDAIYAPAGDDWPRRPMRGTAAVMAFAAAILILVLIGRPVARLTVELVRFVADIDAEPIDMSETSPPPTTTTTVPPPPTTTVPPPPVVAVPPVPTTILPVPDAGHIQLENGTDYERDIRQVHIQLNDAIGYDRSNYEALVGAPELVESLIGRRPKFDDRLRDTLGHLRQALRAKDRNAASAAHTIIYEIEQELGTAGEQ